MKLFSEPFKSYIGTNPKNFSFFLKKFLKIFDLWILTVKQGSVLGIFPLTCLILRGKWGKWRVRNYKIDCFIHYYNIIAIIAANEKSHLL